MKQLHDSRFKRACTRARKQGRAAFEAGLSKCPHPFDQVLTSYNTVLWVRWHLGWLEGYFGASSLTTM